MLNPRIKEHNPPCRTVNIVDDGDEYDYVVAYNVRKDYAAVLTAPRMPEFTAKTFDEPHKCGGCNYEHTEFYSVEGEITLNADNDDSPNGLCATCMMEMLLETQEAPDGR